MASRSEYKKVVVARGNHTKAFIRNHTSKLDNQCYKKSAYKYQLDNSRPAAAAEIVDSKIIRLHIFTVFSKK